MAKSLRSKWKRKMRAIKRERYGKKELDKLKTVVDTMKSSVAEASAVKMTRLTDIVTVVSKKDLAERANKEADDEKMETNQENPVKDNNSGYPVWMSSHRKKKMAEIKRKLNKIKKKQEKKALKRRR